MPANRPRPHRLDARAVPPPLPMRRSPRAVEPPRRGPVAPRTKRAPRAAWGFLCAMLTGALGACGGGGGKAPNTNDAGLFIGPPPSGVVYVQAVAAGTWADGRLGEFRIDGGNGYVYVREDILTNETLAMRTIAHELGHAIGLDHAPGTGCVMDPDAYHVANVTLCLPEIHALGVIAGTLTVYVGLTPNLLSRTGNAASVWNNAKGSTLLAVQ